MLFGDNVYVGNTAVDKIYLGDTEVWSAIPADVKAHIARVIADGGTVPEQAKMVSMVKKLIAANLWNNCVFFGLPLGGVKKDSNQFVSKVYDLKANADLLQTQGTGQPKYQIDGSLKTDGNDLLASSILSSLNPIRTAVNNLTCIIWLKAPITSSAKNIFNRYDTSGNFLVWNICSGASAGMFGKLRCMVSANGGTTNIKNYLSSKTVFDNTLHCIGFTFSKNNLKIYVDGGEDLSITKITDSEVNSLFNYQSNVAIFANAYWQYLLPTNSQLVLPQTYNSTLTPEEILWNYNNIRPEGV